jgi:hypothetical protein
MHITIDENNIPPTPDQLADILDQSADWFLTHRWTQKNPGDGHDAGCMVTSVSLAAMNRSRTIPHEGEEVRVGWSHDALLAVQRHLGKRKVETLPAWNDEKGRTVDDVIEALRMTAKKVREGDIVV